MRKTLLHICSPYPRPPNTHTYTFLPFLSGFLCLHLPVIGPWMVPSFVSLILSSSNTWTQDPVLSSLLPGSPSLQCLAVVLTWPGPLPSPCARLFSIHHGDFACHTGARLSPRGPGVAIRHRPMRLRRGWIGGVGIDRRNKEARRKRMRRRRRRRIAGDCNNC